MAARRDYYEVLGVPTDADATAIKNAFRQLACRYHPDISTEPDAEQQFKKSPKPMACYPTRPSAPATTPTDSLACQGHPGGLEGQPRPRRHLRARRGRVGRAVRGAARAGRRWAAGRYGHARGPRDPAAPGTGRRETDGHDLPAGSLLAVRGQRRGARYRPASLPGLQRDRPAGHRQPPRPGGRPAGDHLPGAGGRSSTSPAWPVRAPGRWRRRTRSPSASRAAPRREPRCGWPGGECPARCPGGPPGDAYVIIQTGAGPTTARQT